MDLGIKGKRALVGGASKGLGLACARELAAEGAEVILVSRSRSNLDEAIGSLPPGSTAHAIVADLSSAAGVEDCLLATEKLGVVDILVNNTGGPPPGMSFDHDVEAWQAANDALLLYVKRMCDALIPPMRKRRWGRVVTITSLTVREPMENLVLSNVYRAGITAYLKGVAREVAADGVTVNSVMPGAYRTARYEQLIRARSERERKTPEEIAVAITDALPQGRFQDPAELGALVAFLASDKASAITGAAIPAEGGMLKGIW